MGRVKARRLAEDMHRRGEASEGTLPKATRRARKRVRSPHRVGQNPGGALSVTAFAVSNKVSISVQLVRQDPLGFINA